MNRRTFTKALLSTVGLVLISPAKLLLAEKKCKYLKPGIYMKERDVSRVYQSKEILDRICRRRALVVIRGEIEEVCSQFLFEPNSEHTRNALKNTLEEYLDHLEMKKCIREYCVVCDETNNTPQIIDDRKLIVDTIVQLPGMFRGEGIKLHIVCLKKSRMETF